MRSADQIRREEHETRLREVKASHAGFEIWSLMIVWFAAFLFSLLIIGLSIAGLRPEKTEDFNATDFAVILILTTSPFTAIYIFVRGCFLRAHSTPRVKVLSYLPLIAVSLFWLVLVAINR